MFPYQVLDLLGTSFALFFPWLWFLQYSVYLAKKDNFDPGWETLPKDLP